MDRDTYLKTFQEYQLGSLLTEQSHPHTEGLAHLAQTQLERAVDRLHKVDVEALEKLLSIVPRLGALREAVQACWSQGGRIYLCGCGATGRLALVLESLWRSQGDDPNQEVIAFMAGGDVALVHSLEGFEDYPEYGARHLKELGFGQKDLFIGMSEGGETPFVIGALEEAKALSMHKPFFLFCNPKELLSKTVERSRRVLGDSGIDSIELCVGPMALSGSTRMQASTVLQWSVGWALWKSLGDSPEESVKNLIRAYNALPIKTLAALITKEAQIYEQGDFVMYTPRYGALTVFTDTTERSPTFSLPAFEPEGSTQTPAWCYVLLPDCENGDKAWQHLLGRLPRALNWPDVSTQTRLDYLKSFDFSRHCLEAREERLGGQRQYLFAIEKRKHELEFTLGGVELIWPWSHDSSLMSETLLKMIMNIHSTLVMGVLGRYRSNVMTWVRASNGKLVDRAARYISQLLDERGVQADYLEIVNRIFDKKDKLPPGEALVDVVLKSFTDKKEP